MVRVGRVALAALVAGCTASADPPQITAANRDLDELSGLAVSHADPTVLWGHNDSGHGPVLYRLGLGGEDLGAVTIPGAGSVDWEDIAAFDDPSGPALLVGDVGDNSAVRATSSLYAVSDPGRGEGARLLWQLTFRYPDGPRDCEAVAVDPLDRSIVLVTKRDRPPRIYRLPLPDRTPPGAQVARFEGELLHLPRATVSQRLASPLSSRYWYEPTALDISRDGLTAVVLTPKQAFRYRRAKGEPWAEVLARPGEPIDLPAFPQTEAAALSPDSRSLYIGSEGRPAALAHVALPP